MTSILSDSSTFGDDGSPMSSESVPDTKLTNRDTDCCPGIADSLELTSYCFQLRWALVSGILPKVGSTEGLATASSFPLFHSKFLMRNRL